jgi:hypothetical protein
MRSICGTAVSRRRKAFQNLFAEGLIAKVRRSIAYRDAKVVGTRGALAAQVIMKTHIANTYDLIVAAESEDKGRSVIETLIYALFIMIAIISIVSAAAQSVAMPSRVAVKDCQAQYCA